jgi:hypothetical protein
LVVNIEVMHMIRIGIYLLSLALTVGGYAARAAGDTKAAELLAQARAALGGDAKVSKVQGLSCSGTLQRALGDRQIAGDVTIDLQLPDKFLRTDSISPMGDSALVVTEQGVNGEKVLRSSKTLNAPPGLVVRMPPPPAPGSDAEMQLLRNARAELVRLSLAMLLSAPSSTPLEYAYAGEAESPDGKADVIDVKGPSGFAAKLFLDKTTHRPLMLVYRGVAPRMTMQMQRGDGPGANARPDGNPQPPAPEQVDINMFLDDYRSVDGVMLPHHITRSIDGKPNEEWTFKTIKLNPTFKTDTFAAK